jgi:hypothetical protein
MTFTELKLEAKNKTTTLTLGGHRPKIDTTKMKCNISLSLSVFLSLSLSLSLSHVKELEKINANDVRCGALHRPLFLVKVNIMTCDQQP